MAESSIPLKDLLADVRSCRLCEDALPLGPRPVLRAETSARILVVGQAPGTRVHATGVPWNDPSGDRLREWMGLSRECFYDASRIAIVPMGFCYPGKGRGGDLPPRPECAEHWHAPLLENLPNVQLRLLIGSFAQHYYLSGRYRTLTERVRDWRRFAPGALPLVHPSPRNQRWLKKNPWFQEDVIPYLRQRVSQLLDVP